MEPTPETAWLLSKTRSGLRPIEETEELCAELVEAGLLREKRTLFGRTKLRMTEKGEQELRKMQHSTNKTLHAAANGLFDHLPFGLFQQMISSPDVERYIESQREVQRLMLLSQFGKPW